MKLTANGTKRMVVFVLALGVAGVAYLGVRSVASSPEDEIVPASLLVWPSDSEGYTPNAQSLVEAYVSSELKWDQACVQADGLRESDSDYIQSFTLVNACSGREVHVTAVRTSAGWGFSQIGEPLRISQSSDGRVTLWFESLDGTDVAVIEVTLKDGTTVSGQSENEIFELPIAIAISDVVSAHLLFLDNEGNVLASAARRQAEGGLTSHSDSSPDEGTLLVPDLVGMQVSAAAELVERLRLEVDVVGSGATVERQLPEPGATVDPGAVVQLYTETD